MRSRSEPDVTFMFLTSLGYPGPSPATQGISLTFTIRSARENFSTELGSPRQEGVTLDSVPWFGSGVRLTTSLLSFSGYLVRSCVNDLSSKYSKGSQPFLM